MRSIEHLGGCESRRAMLTGGFGESVPCVPSDIRLSPDSSGQAAQKSGAWKGAVDDGQARSRHKFSLLQGLPVVGGAPSICCISSGSGIIEHRAKDHKRVLCIFQSDCVIWRLNKLIDHTKSSTSHRDRRGSMNNGCVGGSLYINKIIMLKISKC
jgi:hypothetical protein